MKRILAFLALFISSMTVADSSSRLDTLTKEIWAFYLQNSPIMATRMGVSGSDHLLMDLSPENLQRIHRQEKQFLKQLREIDASELSHSEVITLTVQELQIKNEISNYTYGAHLIPFTSEYGFYAELRSLPKIQKFRSKQDYSNYLQRLSAIPDYFQQQIYWLETGIKKGMTQPREVLEPLPGLVGNFVSEQAQDSVFYGPFKKQPAFIEEADWQLLLKQAQDIIQKDINPAYSKLQMFFQEQYLPKAKQALGALSWPNGEAYYQNRVEHYTTTTLAADEIHKLGLDEVARIRQEMKAVMASLSYEGTLAEFIQFLRTDPQFYAKSEKELLYYAAYLSKKIDSKLPKLFSYLPRTPYGVAPVPASIAPNYTTGRYISPSNDTEAGYYWVNTYALDKRPLYALPALTLHEAVPGHHLQIALSQELDNLPNVRRYNYISAFGEGWGLYSEYLGKEVDFYETPYDEFGRLSYEMWRATRLVVDTGIHTKHWSRQQAVDYMLENTALSEHNVRTEVDRYITWPAQALSYKIGELTIKRLRSKAETQLQDKFDIRDFHKAVLEHGSVPLTVLEENIDMYIQQVKASNQ
ncbi:MAG: DUF885 family protein [Aestuariibacter sp.]